MTKIYEAFCPVCFLSHGIRGKHDPEHRYVIIEKHNFWADTVNSDPDKPFGVIKESLGRGTMHFIGYFSPEEDPAGYFPFIKARLLQACSEWITKGWITKEEVQNMLLKTKKG